MVEPMIICPSEEELQSATQRNIKCTVTGCEQHFSTLPSMWMHSGKTHGIYKDEAFRDAMSNNKKKDRTKSIVKKFFCPIIGCNRGMDQDKPFDRLTTLKTHYINQHAEKKFSCEKCGNKFGSSKYLEIHSNRCGQMFHCSCGVPYTTPEALYVHAKRHKHELTAEFLNSRKHKWRKKQLEAKALNKPMLRTAKKRSFVPLLPKPPVFILHQIVSPMKVSACTQTEGAYLQSYSVPNKKRQSTAPEKRLKEAVRRRTRIQQNLEGGAPQRKNNIANDHFVSRQLQRLASTAQTELANLPYNVIQAISKEHDSIRIQQPSHERNVTAPYSNYSNTPSFTPIGPSLSSQLSSQSPLIYSNPRLHTAGTSSIISVRSSLPSIMQSMVQNSTATESAGIITNTRTSAPSSVFPDNVVTVSSSDDTHPVGTGPAPSTLFPMEPGSSVAPRADDAHHLLSFVNSSTSTESNDPINFRSIGTTFETFGVPTQTDFSLLDLFASCDIQTQTIESIFACSPIVRETSATQTRLQELRNSAVGTHPMPTTDGETLVNNMLEVSTNQSSMQTQTFIAEQSTMETQTPSNPYALNLKTAELQTMTHSASATSPCSQPGPQRPMQEMQTMNTLSSHDLLSLDIYTQTGLDADDLADRTHLDDLEFADIHTQTMDNFDFGVFVDGNSTSVQTDFPIVRGEGSHTVGTQVQRETISTNVQTDILM